MEQIKSNEKKIQKKVSFQNNLWQEPYQKSWGCNFDN